MAGQGMTMSCNDSPSSAGLHREGASPRAMVQVRGWAASGVPKLLPQVTVRSIGADRQGRKAKRHVIGRRVRTIATDPLPSVQEQLTTEKFAATPKARRNRRKTVRKTPEQVATLRRVYDVDKNPGKEIRDQLAQATGLSEKIVFEWFAHCRTKDPTIPKRFTPLTAQQRRVLRSVFKAEQRPKKHQRQALAAQLGISYRRVSKWFCTMRGRGVSTSDDYGTGRGVMVDIMLQRPPAQASQPQHAPQRLHHPRQQVVTTTAVPPQPPPPHEMVAGPPQQPAHSLVSGDAVASLCGGDSLLGANAGLGSGPGSLVPSSGSGSMVSMATVPPPRPPAPLPTGQRAPVPLALRMRDSPSLHGHHHLANIELDPKDIDQLHRDGLHADDLLSSSLPGRNPSGTSDASTYATEQPNPAFMGLPMTFAAPLSHNLGDRRSRLDEMGRAGDEDRAKRARQMPSSRGLPMMLSHDSLMNDA